MRWRCLTENVPKSLELLFNRRTIRRFKSTLVEGPVIRKIVEAGQRAPSACNLQTYTIVWIKDAERRSRVLDACGVSSLTAPVVLVVCADLRRLVKTLDSLDFDHCLRHDYGNSLKLLSMVDASLAAENMTIAAECYELGSLYVGSALANQKLIEILKLPKGVLPEEIKSYLKHMNHTLDKEGYYQKYANRKPSYHYTDHIKRKIDPSNFKQEDKEIREVMKKIGFLLGEAIKG